ncbi:2872_t:CDS:2, partial [Acaulospora colombiana]
MGYVNILKDKALELEQSSTTQGGFQLHSLSNDDLGLLCVFGLLSNPPLIPLLDEETKRYRDGVPRNKLHTIMSRVTNPDE